jgi:hypothetical protein
MTHRDNLDAPALHDVAERLRAARPELTPLELDTTKQRIRARAATPARTRTTKGTPMKSRLAILMTLVLGMMLSTAGAGLAISGAVNGNAAQVQYPDDDDDGDDLVLGEEDEESGRSDDFGGVAGGESGTPQAQPARQVAAGVQGGDDELPFTGFAAIPILIVGVVMTASGVVLRRRLSRED